MFTGIVEGTARVVALESEGREGARLDLDLGRLAAGLERGDSVSVAGACLTVAGDSQDGRAAFELSPETLAKTRFASVGPGDRLNIERSLRIGDSLGGHFVTGHVDGVGRLVGAVAQGEFMEQRFQAPEEVQPYLVPKGSVTVEGVSLTVAEMAADGTFTVALIPETLERTTLGELRPGSPAHMEGDLLGKFVLQHLARAAQDPERLRRALDALAAAPTPYQPADAGPAD